MKNQTKQSTSSAYLQQKKIFNIILDSVYSLVSNIFINVNSVQLYNNNNNNNNNNKNKNKNKNKNIIIIMMMKIIIIMERLVLKSSSINYELKPGHKAEDVRGCKQLRYKSVTVEVPLWVITSMPFFICDTVGLNRDTHRSTISQ